jgi:hypothetical protein
VRSYFRFALIISVLAAACGDSSGPGPSAGPPAGLTVVSGATVDGQAGEPVTTPLAVRVLDAQGNGVPKIAVRYTIASGGGTLSAATDTTDATGASSVSWTLGQTIGAARVEARVTGIVVPAVFNATVRAGPPTALQRTSNPPGTSAAGFELADSVAVRVTDQFGNPVQGATVNFATSPGSGTVSPASRVTNDQGTARVAWTIGTTGGQTLNVSTGAIQSSVTATASACTPTTLAVGQAASLTNPSSCMVLGAGGRYFVSIVNSSTSVGATVPFRMRGLTAGAAASTAVQKLDLQAAGGVRFGPAEDRSPHGRFVAKDLELFRQLLRAQATTPRANVQRSVQAAAVPSVGDMIDLKFPNIAGNLCTQSSAIRGRVLFVGAHSIVVEDSASASAGAHDATFRAAGEEFDTHMWNLLQTNFGNPLAVDASRTNNDGRMYLLFTPRVNNATAGSGQLWGFVTAADFFPSLCPSSNAAEIFYSRVPDANQSTTAFLAEVRRVIMHEAKHVVSYAEKLARATQPTALFDGAESDVWLEEGSAMLAEEIWARSIYGYQQRGNVDYASSLFCERRAATNPTCTGKPIGVFDHFAWLFDYMSTNETKTPFGSVNAQDGSIYGSGWAFLRWLIDHYTTSEAAFLSSITSDATRVGVENVAHKISAVPFTQLIEEWALAMALDDYPGFTPANAKYSFPSWNMRNIFSVLNSESSGYFNRAYPLNVRNVSFGKFAVDVGVLQAGTMSVFEISGTAGPSQMIEVSGFAGAGFPGEARVRVMRVQ